MAAKLKKLLQKLKELFLADPDQTAEIDRLKTELEQARADLAAESAENDEIEALKPEIDELADLLAEANPTE